MMLEQFGISLHCDGLFAVGWPANAASALHFRSEVHRCCCSSSTSGTHTRTFISATSDICELYEYQAIVSTAVSCCERLCSHLWRAREDDEWPRADMCCFIDMTRQAVENVHSVHLISFQTMPQPREICCGYTHPSTCSRLRETSDCFPGAWINSPGGRITTKARQAAGQLELSIV